MKFHSRRPSLVDRRFSSAAVERCIAEVAGSLRDPELAWLFANCLLAHVHHHAGTAVPGNTPN